MHGRRVGCATLAQSPGPDLAWKDEVMQSEAFIISENICISTSRRTLRGVGSTSRRPGQAGSIGLVILFKHMLIIDLAVLLKRIPPGRARNGKRLRISEFRNSEATAED